MTSSVATSPTRSKGKPSHSPPALSTSPASRSPRPGTGAGASPSKRSPRSCRVRAPITYNCGDSDSDGEGANAATDIHACDDNHVYVEECKSFNKCPRCDYKAGSSLSNRSTLTAVLNMLGIKRDGLYGMPDDGHPHTFESFKENGSSPARRIGDFKTMCISILTSVSSLAFTKMKATDPSPFDGSLDHVVEGEDCPSFEMPKYLYTLCLSGAKEVRKMARAVLAKTYTYEKATAILERHFENDMSEEEKKAVEEPSKTMSKREGTRARREYEVMATGGLVTKDPYPYRVKVTALAGVASFFAQTLTYRPGQIRSATVEGVTLSNLPIFVRGGKTVMDLFKTYKASCPDPVGEPAFKRMAELLTRPGECITGQSSYLHNFREGTKFFKSMMERIVAMQKGDKAMEECKDEAENLMLEWDWLAKFLEGEYSKSHVDLDSDDPLHSAKFALRKDEEHNPEGKVCSMCASAISFFPDKLNAFVSSVANGATDLSAAEKKEIESMAAVVNELEEEVLTFMAHKVRARVQDTEVKRIRERINNRDDIVLVLIDHKQKQLPMWSEEAQKHYYAKTGMSMLGAMIVTCKNGIFQFEFMDFIISGHPAQDNVQVAALLTLLLERIHADYPKVKEIILQSDNASCFASQQLIPFIFGWNGHADNKNLPKIREWVYTEAQTGKSQLDTHFSFITRVLNSYIKEGNKITTESGIFEAMNLAKIAGTTAVFVDASELKGLIIINRINDAKFSTKKVGVRATHHIKWFDDCVEVYASSNLSDPEIIGLDYLAQFVAQELMVYCKVGEKSDKPALTTKSPTKRRKAKNLAIVAKEQSDGEIHNKPNVYRAAVNMSGVESHVSRKRPENATRTASMPPKMHAGWAVTKSRKKVGLASSVKTFLDDRYNLNDPSTRKQATGAEGQEAVVQELVEHDWLLRFQTTDERVQAYFNRTRPKEKNKKMAPTTESKLPPGTASKIIPTADAIPPQKSTAKLWATGAPKPSPPSPSPREAR